MEIRDVVSHIAIFDEAAAQLALGDAKKYVTSPEEEWMSI